jgi:hypothetical protein
MAHDSMPDEACSTGASDCAILVVGRRSPWFAFVLVQNLCSDEATVVPRDEIVAAVWPR